MMELRDIRYIKAIAEERSFTLAAQKLYVSQPTLSMCVQRLEKELNTKLFIRERNKLVLTPTGQMFLEDGSQIIEMTQKMTQRIFDVINFDEGVIRVAFSQFYGRYYSPRLFKTFQQHYPKVRIEIIEDFSNHLEDFVAHGELDLCIVPSPVFSAGVAFEPLFQERIYLAAPKELDLVPPNISNNLPAIDLSLVKDQPFIMLKKYQKIRKISDRICQNAGFLPKILFESQDMNTINNFIALNMGVGFVSDIIERTSDKKDLVNYYQIESSEAVRSFVVAYKKGAELSRVCKNFIQLARQQFRAAR